MARDQAEKSDLDRVCDALAQLGVDRHTREEWCQAIGLKDSTLLDALLEFGDRQGAISAEEDGALAFLGRYLVPDKTVRAYDVEKITVPESLAPFSIEEHEGLIAYSDRKGSGTKTTSEFAEPSIQAEELVCWPHRDTPYWRIDVHAVAKDLESSLNQTPEGTGSGGYAVSGMVGLFAFMVQQLRESDAGVAVIATGNRWADVGSDLLDRRYVVQLNDICSIKAGRLCVRNCERLQEAMRGNATDVLAELAKQTAALNNIQEHTRHVPRMRYELEEAKRIPGQVALDIVQRIREILTPEEQTIWLAVRDAGGIQKRALPGLKDAGIVRSEATLSRKIQKIDAKLAEYDLPPCKASGPPVRYRKSGGFTNGEGKEVHEDFTPVAKDWIEDEVDRDRTIQAYLAAPSEDARNQFRGCYPDIDAEAEEYRKRTRDEI